MRVVFALAAFFALVGGTAYLLAKLSDLLKRKKPSSSEKVEGPDIAALNGWTQMQLPPQIQELHALLSERLEKSFSVLPPPNEDIELRHMIPLNPAAYVELDWTDCNYVPVAEVNDGDLLLVALHRPFGAIVVYFHDGAEFDTVCPTIAQMIDDLSSV